MTNIATVFLCVGVVIAGLGSCADADSLTTPGHILLAKTIWQNILPRFESELRLLAAGDKKPRGTLLPPQIPDPDCFGPGFIPINVTIPDPLIKIYGEVGVTSETKAYGFSKIHDDFNLTYTAITGAIRLAWDFGIPEIRLDGDYRMDLTIDLGTTRQVWGDGPLTGTVDSVLLTLRADASAPLVGKIRFNQLDMDLGFSNFNLDGGPNATVGGVQVDWERFSRNFQTYFDTFWNDETRPLINEMITCSLDNLVNNCNIVELINATDCLNTTPNPDCFSLASKPVIETIEIGNVDKIMSFFEPFVVCKDTEPTTANPTTPTADPELTTPTGGQTTPTVESTTHSAGYSSTLAAYNSFLAIGTIYLLIAGFH